MTADDDEPAAPAPEPAAPVLTITWSAVGSAEMTVNANGCTLAQLMAAAYLIDCIAREARAGDLAQRAMHTLAMPDPAIMAALRRQ